METSAIAAQVDRPVSVGAALLQVLRPGPLERQVRAATSLPAWMGPLVALCLMPLIIEVCTFTGEVVDRLDNIRYEQIPHDTTVSSESIPYAIGRTLGAVRTHLRLNAWREISGGPRDEVVAAVIFIPAGFLLGLEVLNTILLAPFVASWGDRLRDARRRTRNLMFVLGPVWALQASLLGAALALILCTGIIAATAWPSILRHAEFLLDGSVVALALGLLLLWVLRLIHSASLLASRERPAVAARCSYCGYLLEGLVDESRCPECGLAAPGLVDQSRQPPLELQQGRTGRLLRLLKLIRQVTVDPRRLFRTMQVLADPLTTRSFLPGVLALSLLAWVVAIPGIAVILAGGRSPRPIELGVAPLAALAIGLTCTLGAVILLGLLILLIGWRMGHVRQEPAWPIAANAGCQLAGWFPWIFVIQGLWLSPLVLWQAYAPPGYRAFDLGRNIAAMLNVDNDPVDAVLIVLPGLVAVGLMFRAAVICYRNVRYACR